MSAHLSSRALNITSIVGPVGNNALHSVGVGAALKHKSSMPIAICCVGDGTTQQGEFVEAVAEAVRSQYPVVFIIEDNSFSISTRTTKQTFFDLPDGPASFFLRPRHHPRSTATICTRRAKPSAKPSAIAATTARRASWFSTSSACPTTPMPTTRRLYRTAGGDRDRLRPRSARVNLAPSLREVADGTMPRWNSSRET